MISDKKLVGNTVSLALMQGANFLFPLMTLPYLVRVLGVENYGSYVLAATVAMFFGTVCDYGFNLTGTRDISLARERQGEVSKTYSVIMSAKCLLAGFSTFAFFFLCVLYEPAQNDLLLYIFSLAYAVAQSFFPGWLLQGLEDSRTVAVLGVLSKFVFTVLVFIFVTGETDGYLAAFLNFLGALSAAFIGYVWAQKKHGIVFELPKLLDVWVKLKEGFFVFLAQLKILLFSGSNVIILGHFVGVAAVGYYSAAEKLMRAVAQIQTPFLTAIYPRLSLELKINRRMAINYLKQVLKAGAIFYAIVAVVLFFFANGIIELIYSEGFSESVTVFRIIIICPLLIYANNIYGTQVLLNMGRDKAYFLVLLIVGLFNLIICTLLTKHIGLIGTSVSLLLSELIVVAGMFLFAKRYFLINSPT